MWASSGSTVAGTRLLPVLPGDDVHWSKSLRARATRLRVFPIAGPHPRSVCSTRLRRSSAGSFGSVDPQKRHHQAQNKCRARVPGRRAPSSRTASTIQATARSPPSAGSPLSRAGSLPRPTASCAPCFLRGCGASGADARRSRQSSNSPRARPVARPGCKG